MAGTLWRRRYEYLLPVWALDPAVGRPRAATQAAAASTPTSAAAAGGAAPTGASASRPAGVAAQAQLSSEDKARLRARAEIGSSAYRLTPLELRRLGLILGVYVGTHCWANFTSEVGVCVGGGRVCWVLAAQRVWPPSGQALTPRPMRNTLYMLYMFI